jgi:hypothetical protein
MQAMKFNAKLKVSRSGKRLHGLANSFGFNVNPSGKHTNVNYLWGYVSNVHTPVGFMNTRNSVGFLL